MKTFDIGTIQEQKTEEIFNFFNPEEGNNSVYYGSVGSGKTSTSIRDIFDLLHRGEIVYANFKINIEDYDERKDKRVVWAKFLGGKKHFFNYKCMENFHYISPQDLIDNVENHNVAFFSRLVGVHLFIDEGQWLFNSLEKYNPNDPDMVAKLKLVLHGRHYCRSLNVITQRASNINKNIRSQVTFWHRCVKRLHIFGWILFQRWTIEDMKDDLPVEFKKVQKKDRVIEVPNGKLKTYWVHIKTDPIFASYNTHGMREEDALEEKPKFDVFVLTPYERLLLLLKHILPTWPRLQRGQVVDNFLVSKRFGFVKKVVNWLRLKKKKYDAMVEGSDIPDRLVSKFPIKRSQWASKPVESLNLGSQSPVKEVVRYGVLETKKVVKMSDFRGGGVA